VTGSPHCGALLALGVADDGGVLLGVAVAAVVAGAVVWLLAAPRPRRLLLAGPLRPAVDGALVALGVLAVIDNLVFHWLLSFHRFKDGWPGSIYVEVGVVVIGVAMAVVGARSLRRQLRRPKNGLR
jgi:uncharacterized membrane protein